jgi:GTPase KRas protein
MIINSVLCVQTYDPTIEDCYRKSDQVDNSEELLDITDMGGAEEFIIFQNSFIEHDSNSVLIAMYAVNDRVSFEQVQIQINSILARKLSG